jgi:hypothetical protein
MPKILKARGSFYSNSEQFGLLHLVHACDTAETPTVLIIFIINFNRSKVTLVSCPHLDTQPMVNRLTRWHLRSPPLSPAFNTADAALKLLTGGYDFPFLVTQDDTTTLGS